MNTHYPELSLDELIDELHLAVEDDVAGPDQHRAADRLNALHTEIMKRHGALDRYRSLITDPSEQMRYNAALAIRREDPPAAYAALKAILSDPRSEIKMKARIALYQLEDSSHI